jgi:dynein heavy chain
MDESSVGWTSYVRSWVDALNYESEKVILRKCFDKYMRLSLDFLHENSSTVVPLCHINLVTSLCRILTALRGNGEELQHVLKSKGEDDYKLALESLFIYALVWGLGGSLADDKRTKHTAAFDRFWRDKFPSDSGFPDQGTVFDYFFDIQHSGRFVHWQDKVFTHTHVPNLPFRNIYVSSADIAKVSHVFGLLVNQKFPVMLVGLAGTGKTAMVKERLRTIQAAEQESTTSSIEIILNYFTNSMRLQTAMESGLEKKTGQS